MNDENNVIARGKDGQVAVNLSLDPCRMQYNQCVSLCLVALVLAQVAALPQHPQYPQQYPQQYQQQQQQVREERKFAEKPNAMKKVALDDLEDISTNQIQVTMSPFLSVFDPWQFFSKFDRVNVKSNARVARERLLFSASQMLQFLSHSRDQSRINRQI